MDSSWLEKKALKEIRKRVFERDEQLRNHSNIKALKQTNFESLAEMTSLNYEEVSQIADSVYREIKEQKKKKLKLLKILLVLNINYSWNYRSSDTKSKK